MYGREGRRRTTVMKNNENDDFGELQTDAGVAPVAEDEARDPMGGDDNAVDAAANDSARTKIFFETSLG